MATIDIREVEAELNRIRMKKKGNSGGCLMKQVYIWRVYIVGGNQEKFMVRVIQDKNRFGFNLILITNTTNPIKCSQVPCWNWFKEEINIINTL